MNDNTIIKVKSRKHAKKVFNYIMSSSALENNRGYDLEDDYDLDYPYWGIES